MKTVIIGTAGHIDHGKSELVRALTGTHPDRLREDLAVDALAKRACLCPRHFSRRFKKAFRRTPAVFVEDLRLNEARQRLSANGAMTIDSISASVGFRSADAFRRAFQRRFGVNPTHYRHRFQVRDDRTLRQVRLPLHQAAVIRDFPS